MPAARCLGQPRPGDGRRRVFIVNRSQTETVVTDIVWQDADRRAVEQAWQLAGTDPKEANTWEEPNRLVAKAIAAPHSLRMARQP